jgi:hypothetical protein
MTTGQPASDAAVRRTAEFGLVASDFRWAWGVARDAAAQVISSPFPMLCVMPCLSLIIYESQRYLIRVEPALAEHLTVQYADTIEQSRHRMKLFDDTHLGMAGVAEYFSEDLMAAHWTKFIESVRFIPLASFWKSDLGLSTYGDTQIATTFVIHFNLGTSPDMITRDRPAEPKGMGVDIGGYLATLTPVFESQFPQLDWTSGSFLAQIHASKLAQRDVRSRKYYDSCFGGQLPMGILAALDAFRCALNTINVLMSADTSPDSAPTLFKLRFITLYHVLSGLRQLHTSHSQWLDEYADRRLTDLENHSTTTLLCTDNARWLRNTLIHYQLASQCPTTALDLGRPLSGLADFYFLDVGFETLADQIQEHAELVAGLLNDWANSP